MKKAHRLAWTAIGLMASIAAGSAHAQERARVLQAVPVTQQVGIPQEVCGEDQVYNGQRTTGTGAVIGAIVGGVAGNALGQGGHRGRHGYYSSNRGATTAIGAIAGGLIGNQIEGTTGGSPSYQTVRRCTTETVYENRAIGYDVTYEYAGRRYTTRMDYDPGPWMSVDVQPSHTYSSTPAQVHLGQSDSRFVGPSGVYEAAAPHITVTESVTTYEGASVPVIVEAGPRYPSYPAHPPRHWRPANPYAPY